MNETGSYPGQPLLWLYQLWYELPGLRNSANVDLIAIDLTDVATVLVAAVPFVPGRRELPRVVPVHRLIWRQWYERARPVDGEVDGAGRSASGHAKSARPRNLRGASALVVVRQVRQWHRLAHLGPQLASAAAEAPWGS